MLIKALKSEPKIFDTVKFSTGINLITGERSGDTKSGNKTNGVGKSLLLDFIDFCLLGDCTKNRINEIPVETLPLSTRIVLELICDESNIIIKRSKKEETSPIIYVNGTEKKFSSLNDAKKYLFKCVFGDKESFSLRAMLSIFKRKERRGFNEIDNTDGSRKDSFLRKMPYLYLFGFNINLYKMLKEKASILAETHKYLKILKNDILSLGIDPEEAAACRNDLKAQVDNIDEAVEQLSQYKVYDAIAEDIADLDLQLEQTGIKLIGVKEEIQKIDNLPEYQKISKHDILAVFNDCKKSLGDLIVREIEEVEEFKRIIDKFKIDILSSRKEKLLKLQKKLSEKMKVLSKEYKRKIAVFDKDGNLRSLKASLHEQELKRQEYNKISLLSDHYQEYTNKKVTAEAERSDALSQFTINKEQQKYVIASFEDKIFEIHECLYGNRKASFDIRLKKTQRADQKDFIEFYMKTDDAGSARTEHEKILIFDFALLFCVETRTRHPKFLIHDGAFEGVNEDTKFQLLNWLHKRQNEEFQYIVTINRDSFESLENSKKFSFNLGQYVKADYAKDRRFLKTKYISVS